MQLKITRDVLVGTTVKVAGDVIEADGRFAEHLVRSGAGVPVAPKVETAAAPPAVEKAVAPKQK